MGDDFPQSYRYEVLQELPAFPELHYYFPSASQAGGSDGLIVRIQSVRSKVWRGTFAFGRFPKAVTGIFSTPNPRRVCIVAQGAGYFVNVDDPSDWECVQGFPITDVRLVAHQRMIVFADFCALTAYGSSGKAWSTRRIAWDGLRITSVDSASIRGECEEVPGEGLIEFTVDLTNGQHDGGAKFPF
jgi:hypothetical protein